MDITDFIPKVARAVLTHPEHSGIMICGTGIGVDIGANRFKGIRSALAATPEVAKLGKIYDNANVLCLSGRALDRAATEAILEAWFGTPFDDPDGKRNEKMNKMDTWE